MFKPPPPKVAVAAGSIDEDEKPGPTENDVASVSTTIRSNSSRRYRGSGSDDKTSLNGASFSLNKIHELQKLADVYALLVHSLPIIFKL